MGNKRQELNLELLDEVTGGSIGFNPDDNGTFTMVCGYSGNTYYGVSLPNVIEIAKFGATLHETPEDEQVIISWAKEKGYI